MRHGKAKSIDPVYSKATGRAHSLSWLRISRELGVAYLDERIGHTVRGKGRSRMAGAGEGGGWGGQSGGIGPDEGEVGSDGRAVPNETLPAR